MNRAGLLALLLLCGPVFAIQDRQACPEGTYRIATDDPLEPFHCKTDLRTDQPYITMTPDYQLHPCPKGKHAVLTPGLGSAHRYRCAPNREAAADPTAAPLLPGQAAPSGQAASAPTGFSAPADYARVTVEGAFQVEVPRNWQVSQAWDEETPGFYVQFDTGRQGRQVQLTISKIERSQEDYASVTQAVAREIDQQNAVEEKPQRVAGFPARLTGVKGSMRTAYVPISDEDYFVLTYTAPTDLFSIYEPVFLRMLATFRIAKDQRR